MKKNYFLILILLFNFLFAGKTFAAGECPPDDAILTKKSTDQLYETYCKQNDDGSFSAYEYLRNVENTDQICEVVSDPHNTELFCEDYEEIKNGSQDPKPTINTGKTTNGNKPRGTTVIGGDPGDDGTDDGGTSDGGTSDGGTSDGGTSGGSTSSGGDTPAMETDPEGWPVEVDIPGGPSIANQPITFTSYIDRIYFFITLIAGFLGALMFVIGGFQYLTSAGNTSATAKAKETMFAAIAGILIIVTAYLLLRIISREFVELQDPGSSRIENPNQRYL
ncbi:MAG: hypothetical protein GF347_02250 [Candidatus Moranbacteria bacterium]|nr:hypothetical protein [Candidatus Moranbacteria bacterium]